MINPAFFDERIHDLQLSKSLSDLSALLSLVAGTVLRKEFSELLSKRRGVLRRVPRIEVLWLFQKIEKVQILEMSCPIFDAKHHPVPKRVAWRAGSVLSDPIRPLWEPLISDKLRKSCLRCAARTVSDRMHHRTSKSSIHKIQTQQTQCPIR